jgi:hypothetical protein
MVAEAPPLEWGSPVDPRSRVPSGLGQDRLLVAACLGRAEVSTEKWGDGPEVSLRRPCPSPDALGVVRNLPAGDAGAALHPPVAPRAVPNLQGDGGRGAARRGERGPWHRDVDVEPV